MEDFEDQPNWLVYRPVDPNEPFTLRATTKNTWDSMMEHKRSIDKFEVVAEGLTYDVVIKMIRLTKGN